jgi:hypothetical protein
MTLIRRWSTDQDWLRRADHDRKRIKELLRQARREGDREAVSRYKATAALIRLRSMRFEWKPLLLAIPPIVLVATWCFARLGFHPPNGGETVSVRAYVARSGIGGVAHMLPQDGIEAGNRWIREVVRDAPPEPRDWWERLNQTALERMGKVPVPEGVATWNVRAAARAEPYVLTLVLGGRTYRTNFLVGQKTYAPPVIWFGPESPVRAIEIALRPLKMFGVVPGIPLLFHMPPWLLAYLVIVFALYPLSRRVFRVY